MASKLYDTGVCGMILLLLAAPVDGGAGSQGGRAVDTQGGSSASLAVSTAAQTNLTIATQRESNGEVEAPQVFDIPRGIDIEYRIRLALSGDADAKKARKAGLAAPRAGEHEYAVSDATPDACERPGSYINS